MKIAICFSGQPRFVDECHEAIKTNLIDANGHHQVDVFVHTWFSEEICEKPLYTTDFSSFSGGAKIKRNVIERIKELYSPVALRFDEPLELETSDIENRWDSLAITNYLKWSNEYKNEIKPTERQLKKTESAYSIYYSIMQSNMLKILHEVRTGEKYDLVIKLRFDNKLQRPLVFDGIDTNFMYSEELGNAHYEINDWINFSSSQNMDRMASIFYNFNEITKLSTDNYGGWSNESLIGSICNIYDIQSKTTYLGSKIPTWGKYV